MSGVASLLRAELDGFSRRYELTPREYDVVFLLVHGHSTVSQIADRLGLSQNTIHNHFKNVFRRTGTNSKAGLLALFIREAMGRQAEMAPFIKRPRVLLVEPDPGTRNALNNTLTGAGLWVSAEPHAPTALRRIAELSIDLVVADASVESVGGGGILVDVLERYGPRPAVLLTTADTHAPHQRWLAEGAADVFEKPIATERLLFSIFQHFIDTPFERSRLLRVDASLPVLVQGQHSTTLSNLGFGGCFVVLDPQLLEGDESFVQGQRISLRFALDEPGEIEVTAQIAWRRNGKRPTLPSGVGVRFLELSDKQQAAIEDYVRKRKLRALTPWPVAPSTPGGKRTGFNSR